MQPGMAPRPVAQGLFSGVRLDPKMIEGVPAAAGPDRRLEPCSAGNLVASVGVQLIRNIAFTVSTT